MFAGLSCMGCHVQFRHDLLRATLEAGGVVVQRMFAA